MNRARWPLVGCTVPGFLLPTDELLRDVYVRGPGTLPAVALTFDDGPNGRCTEAVLDALAAHGAPATFFVLGANVAGGRNDELLARMVHEGHVIGIHSYSHGVRALFWESNTARELRAAAAEVEVALRRAGVSDPAPVTLFRPPFGFLTAASARAAAAAGMHIVEWTVSVGDWRSTRRAEDVSPRWRRDRAPRRVRDPPAVDRALRRSRAGQRGSPSSHPRAHRPRAPGGPPEHAFRPRATRLTPT